MRKWNLKAGDPLALTLVADARLGPTDYCDDQIWELRIGGGDPPALALQTTFGLRARSMRVFPRFGEGDSVVTAPVEFVSGPVVTNFFPNYLCVQCSPLSDIDAELEYWVPQSHAVAGRVGLMNNGSKAHLIRLSLITQLNPTDGQRMAPIELQTAPALAGRTGELAPVVFLTGGPQAVGSPYPALTLEIELPPGATRRFTWCHTALQDVEASFSLARQVVACSWEAEIARVELLNSAQLEVYTGDPDWDAAFAFSQKLAAASFVGPTQHLPSPSIVLSRQPDQGYSLRGDGSDYNHLWNGQSPLEIYYLAGFLLPGGSQLLKGLVRNYIAVQEEDGSIDWKPGLAGQRTGLLAMPILATISWQIYQIDQDRVFLEEVFEPLRKFVHRWFDNRHDRDGDGVPEWDHPMQAGFEDHPIFSRWHEWSQGVDISSAESPALCALLYRECQSLIQMGHVLGRLESIPGLKSYAAHLQTALDTAWAPRRHSYLNWDRDSHYSTIGEKLGERTGSGEVLIQRHFDRPVRLFVRIKTADENTRSPELFIYGESASGQPRVERVPHETFQWFLGQGNLTGERVYAQLERVMVQGISQNDRVSLFSVGYSRPDHTVLLPLWSGIPDKKRALRIVGKTIMAERRYWRPYGIPACPGNPPNGNDQVCRCAHLPWNDLIGEGLLSYGYREEVTELVTRLMAAIIRNLKQNGAFSRYYQVETGEGLGERNVLTGLAPLNLFLNALGVRIYSQEKVILSGSNPFPWPVTVKYRGLTVLRRVDSTVVTFPDGQTTTITDPSPQVITLA